MRLVCKEGGSDKFCEGSLEGNTLHVRFGRVGTLGQRRERSCATRAAAERELAKLIAEKQRKGYRRAADAPVAATPSAAGSISLAFQGRPLPELAARLGADRALLDEIELASSSPAAYLERFSERLGERGIHAVRADLGWFALIDGLMARAKLAELDVRASPDEVLEALIALDPAHRPAAWRGYVRECDRALDPLDISSWHCLTVADRRLRARGLALVYLSIVSDSTPVVVVAVDEVERLGLLARASGAGELGPVCGAPSVPTRLGGYLLARGRR
jgi:predicted DNA-binding WGR domain protein